MLIDGIDSLILVIASNDGYAVGQRLEHLVQISLAPPQGVFGSLAIGDIDDDRSKRSRCAFRRRNSERIDMGPYGLAILAPVTLLNLVNIGACRLHRVLR